MNANEFLISIGQSPENVVVEDALEAFQQQMNAGLAGEASSLAMIPTYLYEPDTGAIFQCDRRIVIDAGGTNFRSAIGYFNESGKAVFEDVEWTKMPASDRELSCEEFYGTIAGNVARLAARGGDVGFCFSYPVEIEADKDGRAGVFTKEIKAPQVVGTRVGASTLHALKKYSDKERSIVILNDTVATLLGGMAGAQKAYSGYVGYIYGTGTNLCYLEESKNIRKLTGLDASRRMIINTECGNFDGFPLGVADKLVLAASNDPARYRFEKMTSGKYLSSIMEQCLREAQNRDLYAGNVHISPFALSEVSEFLSTGAGRVAEMLPATSDREFAKECCLLLIDRAAKMGAIANAAAAIRCGNKGGLPVAVVAEGTTFHKLFGYTARFASYLESILTPIGISFEIVKGEDVNLVGTLLATLA